MISIFKRELFSYFTTPIGYVFIGLFFLFSGASFYLFALSAGSSDLSYVFLSMFFVLMIFVPVLTMRLFSEEKKQKTDQLILTAPVSRFGIILGKFLSAYTVFLSSVFILIVYAVTLSFFAPVSWNIVIGNIVGIMLLGSVYVAAGLFVSSLTENQLIASIGSMAINLAIFLFDTLAAVIPVPFVKEILESISVYRRYSEFTLGIFSVSNVIFFISVTAIFLFLCSRKRKLWLSAVLVVGVIVLNIGINITLDYFDVKADLTSAGIYTLDKNTEEYLKTVNDDVEITITTLETDFKNLGIYYAQTNETAQKIAKCNQRFKINYVDIAANPGYSAGYDQEIVQNMIIVKSTATGRVKILNFEEYLDITYDEEMLSYGVTYPVDVKANAEQAIASAIMRVTAASPVRVAFASGFGEQQNAHFAELLDRNGYLLEGIDLNLTAEISEEIDFLILYAPAADYSSEVISNIEKWLNNGGKYGKNIIYTASVTQGVTPNIEEFLESWGLKIGNEIIYQTDGNYSYPISPTYQYLQPLQNDFTKNLNPKFFIFGDNLRAISIEEKDGTGIVSIPIVSSYNGGVLMPRSADSTWKPDETTKGEHIVIAESNKAVYENDKEILSSVFVFSSTELFAPSFLSASSANNSDLIISIFNNASGKEQGVVLKSKTFDMNVFQIPAETANVIAVILVIVLPVLIIGLGIGVFIKRKNM